MPKTFNVNVQLLGRLSMLNEAQQELMLRLAEQMQTTSSRRLYKTWRNMRYRCSNPKDRKYKYYGGRGIKVCEEWDSSFKAFESWALVNGYADDLTIDRINVNGDYEPKNCRWISMAEQQQNKRSNRSIKPTEECCKIRHTIPPEERGSKIQITTLNKDYIEKLIYCYEGDLDELAQKLGMTRRTLQKRRLVNDWWAPEIAALANIFHVSIDDLFIVDIQEETK